MSLTQIHLSLYYVICFSNRIFLTGMSFVTGSSRELQAHREGVRVPALLEDAAVSMYSAEFTRASGWTQIHRLLERVSLIVRQFSCLYVFQLRERLNT